MTMELIMMPDEWDTKFKNLEENKCAWIYRDYHGMFREIVRTGALPAFITVNVKDVKKVVMQIYDIKKLQTNVISTQDRQYVTGPITHAIELKYPDQKKYEQIGLYKWDTECDWWFESLEPQFQADITKNPISKTPLEIWNSWPLEFRKRVYSAKIEEMNELMAEVGPAPEIPVENMIIRKLENESEKIMEQMIVDDDVSDIEELPEPESTIPLPPPPEEPLNEETPSEDNEDLYECENCGADVGANDPYCPECGIKFSDIEDESLESSKPKEQSPPSPEYLSMKWNQLRKYASGLGIKTYGLGRDEIHQRIAEKLT